MSSANQQLNLPAGFRFHPTDEELVVDYLCRKCAGQQISAPIVAEVDLYKFDPWQLPAKSLYGEKEWYFFSPRDRKYPNGSRPNRAARTGYWKATGADKPVGKPKTLGIKKSLVFYAGKAPKGVKTNWIMHEYRLANVDRSVTGKKGNSKLDDWVLCRIYNKKGTIEKHESVVDQNEVWLSDSEEEKPNVDVLALQMIDDYLHSDTTGLAPTLHTDSSSSENGSSPEFVSDKEGQSGQPNWGQFGGDLDFQLDFLDGIQYDSSVSQMQYNDQLSMFQDMFAYTKPF